MLKETETEDTIGFVSRFLSLVAFQLKRGRALCPPLASRQKFMKKCCYPIVVQIFGSVTVEMGLQSNFSQRVVNSS